VANHEPKETAEQLADISRQAQEMASRVEQLGASVGVGVAGLRRRTGRHSKALWLLAGSFVLDGLLTVALAITGAEVIQNANRLEAVQKVAADEALCPLYGVFLASARTQLPRAQDESDVSYRKRVEARDAAILIIKHGYDALECKP
jgi:hypothetical protein